MRVNPAWRQRLGVWFVRLALAGIVTGSLVPVAFAGELMQTMSNLWVPATALSLALASAVGKSQK
jgi:hypothetical protein